MERTTSKIVSKGALVFQNLKLETLAYYQGVVMIWCQRCGAFMLMVFLGCGSSTAPDRFAQEREKGAEEKPGQKPLFAENRVPAAPAKPIPKASAFDGERAIKYLNQLCDIGPRISGSDGMKKQQKLLEKHFEDLGAKVTRQEFVGKQPSRRDPCPMTNLIATWFPERKNRIILCAHYDTRPQADQEDLRASWNKPFVSANDGTSGVAFLMELAHVMKDFPTEVGVDFVLFDGEEYIFSGPDGDDKFFLGSEHFANEYKKNLAKLPYKYTAAILFDLFAHENARLAVEGYSWEFAKELVTEVWNAADEVQAKTFKFERGFNRAISVQDDHIALQNVGIPAIDILDFDYKHWHKLSDTADKCSAKQMTTVAHVITTWLKSKK